VFNTGADKVSINTAAIKNPIIINKLSRYFGSQACVIAIDAKRRYGKDAEGKTVIKTPQGACWFECSIYGGRTFTGVDAIKWALEVEERGAGEILLASMDRGYDIPLTEAVSERVRIPVIASSGCGVLAHIHEVFQRTKVNAALAASIFHYEPHRIKEVKTFLAERNHRIRLKK
jgi:cyclase